jgi:hypothetical protein
VKNDNTCGTARVLVFPVVTNFETMARRPGGLPRHQAVLNARIRVQRLFGRGSRPAAKQRHRGARRGYQADGALICLRRC